MPYQVVTPVFEGPFDLLLHLILREQVDVYQVSLLPIVDAYLAEVAAQAERTGVGVVDLETATEFLVIAATLLELKTRRLLPRSDDSVDEDDLALLEERDLLLSRLLECKTFRDAGAALARLVQRAGQSWPRTAGLEERFLALVPDLLAGVTPADLAAAYERASAPKPAPLHVDLDHVAPIRVSVGEAVDELAATLPGRGRVSFRDLTAGVEVRMDVIVRFLALLQLYKDGRIDLDQAATFGELIVVWTGGEAGEADGPAAPADDDWDDRWADDTWDDEPAADESAADQGTAAHESIAADQGTAADGAGESIGLGGLAGAEAGSDDDA